MKSLHSHLPREPWLGGSFYAYATSCLKVLRPIEEMVEILMVIICAVRNGFMRFNLYGPGRNCVDAIRALSIHHLSSDVYLQELYSWGRVFTFLD